MSSNERCSVCGYTEQDAKTQLDHHLCKNYGNAPWERKTSLAPAPPSINTSIESSIGAELPAGFIEKHGLIDPTDVVKDEPAPKVSVDRRPPKPDLRWEWYSLCSRHGEYDPNCKNCNAGQWISDHEREFDNWLWTYSPEIWQKWANRHNVSGWREWLRKNVWTKK